MMQLNVFPTAIALCLTVMNFSAFCTEPSHSAVELFPGERLFKPKIADPAEVQLSARFRTSRDEFVGNIGYSIGIVEFAAAGTPIQFRIEGNTFLVSKVQTPDFPVQSTDYTIAVPIDFRSGSWSSRMEWLHISSHLGDNFNRIENVEEAIAYYGDEHSLFSIPQKWSREFIKSFVAYEHNNTRVYGGIIWAYHIATARAGELNAQAWSLQFGYEWVAEQSSRMVFPFIALDVKTRQELGWDPAFNLQAGLVVGQSRVRRMRFGLEFFDGFSNQGQFLARKERDLSLVMAFDF